MYVCMYVFFIYLYIHVCICIRFTYTPAARIEFYMLESFYVGDTLTAANGTAKSLKCVHA